MSDGAAELRETLVRLQAHMDTVVITPELREIETHLERQIAVYDFGVWEYAAALTPGETE